MAIYGQRIIWHKFDGSRTEIAVNDYETPEKAAEAAIFLAKDSGWTLPKWWQWWRRGDTRISNSRSTKKMLKKYIVHIEQVNQTFVEVMAANEKEALTHSRVMSVEECMEKGYAKWRLEVKQLPSAYQVLYRYSVTESD